MTNTTTTPATRGREQLLAIGVGTSGHEALEAFSDAELLDAVREGTMDAYAVLFTRHRKTAVNIARWYLQNHDEAIDVVHDAFTNILAAITTGAGPVGTFRPYLRTTIAHQAQKRFRYRTTETLVPEHPEHLHETMVEDITEHLIDPALRQAFTSLPHRWQLAIWYLDINDLQPQDTAPLFGITPNALVALHRRAKKGLHHAYTNHADKKD